MSFGGGLASAVPNDIRPADFVFELNWSPIIDFSGPAVFDRSVDFVACLPAVCRGDPGMELPSLGRLTMTDAVLIGGQPAERTLI